MNTTTSIVLENFGPRQNKLLAALFAADYRRLLPDLELVPLPAGKTIYDTGAKRGHVYSPTAGIISKHFVMEDGASTVFAVVGSESVSEAAGQLQKTGGIENGRGKITVLDRTAPEKLACECYAVEKNEFDRLFVPEPKLVTGH